MHVADAGFTARAVLSLSIAMVPLRAHNEAVQRERHEQGKDAGHVSLNRPTRCPLVAPETPSPLGSPPPLISRGRGPVPHKHERKRNHWHDPSPTAKELEGFSVFSNFLGASCSDLLLLLPLILPAAFLLLPHLPFFMLFTSCWASI